MTDAYWYEAVIVDEEMPVDRYHEDEEIYQVLARNEAEMKLAVTLALGDRYGVVRVTHENELVEDEYNKSIDEIIETTETDVDSGKLHSTINAFEVFEEASFRVWFKNEEGERFEYSSSDLEEAVEWYFEHEESKYYADYPEKNAPRYDGDTEATYGNTMEMLSESRVHEVAEQVVPEPMNAA